MKYVGIQSQIWKNNINSVVMLIVFPLLLLGVVFVVIFFSVRKEYTQAPADVFMRVAPFVMIVTGIWFLVAWLFHSAIMRKATGSRPLERMENKRVYNLVENLCIANGMKTPAINIIEDDSLNAFASGLSDS